MNKDLAFLLNSGDVCGKRTLLFTIDDEPVAYTTEYHMQTKLGPFKWWLTWRHPSCTDRHKTEWASITVYDARARVFFPAYLDCRIPPANREEPQLSEILTSLGLSEYDKFDICVRSGAHSPIKPGYVQEVAPLDCPYEDVHAIDEIVTEYLAELS